MNALLRSIAMPAATYPKIPTTPPMEGGITRHTSKNSSRLQKLSKISYFMPGTPLKVDYHHQILAEDEDAKQLDVTLDATNQTYSVIAGLTILVTSPISSSRDAKTGVTSVTGEANVYSFLKPAIGDIFLSATIEGNTGLFALTSVSPFSYNARTNYSIEYSLISLLEEDPVKYDNLKAKTIKEYYFDEELLKAGHIPIISMAQATARESIRSYLTISLNDYVRDFLDEDVKTFLVPVADGSKLYDDYLVEFMRNILFERGSSYKFDFTRYDIPTRSESVTSIWTVLKDRAYLKTDKIGYAPGIEPINRSNRKRVGNSLIYSPLDNLLTLKSDTHLPSWKPLTAELLGAPVAPSPTITSPAVGTGAITTPTTVTQAPTAPTAAWSGPVGVTFIKNDKIVKGSGKDGRLLDSEVAAVLKDYVSDEGAVSPKVESLYRLDDVIYLWTDNYKHHSGVNVDLHRLGVAHSDKETLPNGDKKISHFDKDHKLIKLEITHANADGTTLTTIYDPVEVASLIIKDAVGKLVSKEVYYTKPGGAKVVTYIGPDNKVIKEVDTETLADGNKKSTITIGPVTTATVTKPDGSVVSKEVTTKVSDTITKKEFFNPTKESESTRTVNADGSSVEVTEKLTLPVSTTTTTKDKDGVLVKSVKVSPLPNGGKDTIVTTPDGMSVRTVEGPTGIVALTSVMKPITTPITGTEEVTTQPTGVTTILTDANGVIVSIKVVDTTGKIIHKAKDGTILKTEETIDLPAPDGDKVVTVEYIGGKEVKRSIVFRAEDKTTVKTVTRTSPDLTQPGPYEETVVEGSKKTTTVIDPTGTLTSTTIEETLPNGDKSSKTIVPIGDYTSALMKIDGSVYRENKTDDTTTVSLTDPNAIVVYTGTKKILGNGNLETKTVRGDGKVKEDTRRNTAGTVLSGTENEYDLGGTLLKSTETTAPIDPAVDPIVVSVTTKTDKKTVKTYPNGNVRTTAKTIASKEEKELLKDAAGKVLEDVARTTRTDQTVDELAVYPDKKVYKHLGADGIMLEQKTQKILANKDKEITVLRADGTLKYTILYNRVSYASSKTLVLDSGGTELPLTKNMASPFTIASEYENEKAANAEKVKEGKAEPDELVTVKPDTKTHVNDGYSLIGGVSNSGSSRYKK